MTATVTGTTIVPHPAPAKCETLGDLLARLGGVPLERIRCQQEGFERAWRRAGAGAEEA